MRGLEVADAAEFDERDVADLELHLEHRAVRTGAHEHGLLSQRYAVGVDGEDAVGDRSGLLIGVLAAHELGPGCGSRPVGDEPDREVLRAGGVGEVEDRLGGAEVPLQADELGVGMAVEDLLQLSGAGAAEAVDRLRVVAHHGQTSAVGSQPSHDVRLHAVHVLILVDEHPVPARAQSRPHVGIAHERAPRDQQVVQVEQSACPFALRIGAQEPHDLVRVSERPRELVRDHLATGLLQAHRAGRDVGHRPARGHPPVGAVQTVLAAQEIEEVGDVVGRQHGDIREPQVLRVLGDDAVGHRVEGPSGDALGERRVADHRRRARRHRGGRAPCEREEQYALGRHARVDQPGDPAREHAGLPRAGAGGDDQRPLAVLDGTPLHLVQLFDHVCAAHG